MGLKPYFGKTVPDSALFASSINGRFGAVSCNNAYAAKAGLAVLKQGGNAFDAAAAISLTLGVVEPYMSGIGGGGFSLIYDAEKDCYESYDGRGVAPQNAYQDMFLGKDGEPDPSLTEFSGRAVATPALYRILDRLLNEHGTMTLKQISAPAIELARNGFRASFMYSLGTDTPHADHNKATYHGFSELYTNNGEKRGYGELITNNDLAETLEAVSINGIDWFYNGPIADEIVNVIQNNFGLMTKNDLIRTKAVKRTPVEGTYRNCRVVSMAPPSSGGIHLLQMLNMLENVKLHDLGHNSADYIHVLAETMKMMFADRSVAMGDPDYVSIETEKLLSKEYARKLAEKIDLNKAKDYEPSPGIEAKDYQGCTTHFCVWDAKGNIVSQTQTIRNWWGSGVVVPGRGFILNNNMADFSAKTGRKTSQGLSYGSANSISPGKTPLSSMTPAIISRNGKPFCCVGSAGGPRIITSVLQTILNIIDFDMPMNKALMCPQVACLGFGQVLELEANISPDTRRLLQEKGHVTLPLEQHAVMKALPNGILCKDGTLFPGGTNRVDGGSGVLLEDGTISIDAYTFQ